MDGGMEDGGSRRRQGETEINQQATPTVLCLWGVETCIYVADWGVGVASGELERVCKRVYILLFV